MVSATTGGKKERVDQRYERIWRSFERYGKRFFGKPREKNTTEKKSQITCDVWKNEDIKEEEEEEEEEDNTEAQILTNEEGRDDERRFFLLLRAADGEKTSFSS